MDRERPINITIKQEANPITTVNADAKADATAQASAQIDFRVELPALQSALGDLKTALGEQLPQDVQEEVAELDKDLLNVHRGAKEPAQVPPGPFNRLWRLLDQINHEDSSLHKAIKASRKGLDAAKRLASTYNKIAGWLDLQDLSIPFLG